MIIYGRPILHTYANEDVSLGSWFIGLDVEHVDDRSMCCGTPPGNSILILWLMMDLDQRMMFVFITLLIEFSRLWVEGKRRECMRGVIRLAVQWDLQCSRKDERSAQFLWGKRWCRLECWSLIFDLWRHSIASEWFIYGKREARKFRHFCLFLQIY